MSKFNVYLLAMGAAILAFVSSFFFNAQADAQLDRAYETRRKSLLLAEELRQSSNDLTRLVRTYVITGDPAFKRQFEAVREIRDGTRARPVDYGPSYWDFYAVEGRASEDGAALPLLEAMRIAGFAPQELAKLADAKLKSDELTKTEYRAMALVESEQALAARGRERAIAMLHDESFHRAKFDIMRPIVEFDRMVDTRTWEALQAAHLLTSRMRTLQIGLGLLLLVLLWRVSRELRAILGCPVAELQETIARLGAGDFSSGVAVRPHREDSVLAWVADTQTKLARMELLQFRAIVSSSDDAIVSKTTEGIITSWNTGAEQLFGYTSDEVIGKPMLLLFPPDRVNEEPDILARITRGERVEHFETVRRRKDGQLIDVSVSISPIRDGGGRVVGASKIARDISRAKAAEAQIHQLAFFDPLTQLPNRRLLHDRLSHALRNARRLPQSCAVLFIDLDNFKTLNDTRGHDVGDLLLQAVADRLRACVRANDTVARFGGDEFVILLENATDPAQSIAKQTELVGAKILAQLAAPYELAGAAHFCTPSIGVAIPDSTETTSKELLKRADLAMYQAKAAGRNALRFFDPQMQTALDRSAALDRELRDALAKGQFVLQAQPQVSAEGVIFGGELLLRWQHPSRGLLLPDEFIPQAEESGCIQPISAWVLENACRQLARWATQPQLRDITQAVNIGAKPVSEPGFAGNVLALLEQTGANPQRLKLELTERALGKQVETLITKLAQLRARGVRIALDDFGAGHASLAHLKRMPLDELKIGRDLVKDMLRDPSDAAIIQTVATLARSLGLEVMADGVEREAQRQALLAMGCDALQGTMFGAPMPLDAFAALVLAQQSVSA